MHGEEEIRKAAESAQPAGETPPDDKRELELFHYQRNDYGNGQRLLKRFGERLIYVKHKGWYAWDGKRWNGERGEQLAHRLAHATHLALFAELEAYKKDSDPLQEGVMQQRASHKKWAVNSGNSTRLHNMLGEVRPYVETRIEALDANPYLLCVENCTLDLQGGIRRRRHTPADLLTRCAPVSYDPEAGCPVFRAFLQRILPDPEEQMFLQRWLGYGLTGDISEQKLLLCHGEGRNGKSTLLKALVHVFGPGEYAVMLPFESILQNDKKRGSEASPDLARLPGARLVAATEPESNARLSSGMIKRMTGGEPITARDLNKGFFDFVPQFKMILLFNDKPTMPAQDEGTWRRIMMLDFKEMISDAEKDRHLDDKLAAEKNGILNWLLDGYRLWLERGVAPPPSVLAATQEYRDENDAIGRFLNETVTVMAGEYVTAKELMAALKKWCEDSGLRPISQRRLGDRMKQLGFAKDMGGKDKTYRYLNLKLLSPSPSGNSGYSREFL